MMTKVIRITSAPENLSTCTEFLKKKKKDILWNLYFLFGKALKASTGGAEMMQTYFKWQMSQW